MYYESTLSKKIQLDTFSELVGYPIVFSSALTYDFYSVIEGETFESIAYKKYGDSGKWVYIASANNRDHNWDIAIGDVIKIPML